MGRSSVGRADTANQRGIFDGKSKKTFGGFLFCPLFLLAADSG